MLLNPRRQAETKPQQTRVPSNRAPASRPVYQWSHQVPILGRAMVLAGDALFVAGPPDVVDTELTMLHLSDPQTHAKLAQQTAAFEGRMGGRLQVVSASDGKELTEIELDAPPVFDGMAAAGERLYLATTDGNVICYGGR